MFCKKFFLAFNLLFIVFLLSACGGGGSNNPATSTTLSGTAATGEAFIGAINIYGANGGQILDITIDAAGNYSIDVNGLTSPYLIEAEPDSNTVQNPQYSTSTGPGTANVTPMTTLAMFIANNESDPAGLVASWPADASAVQDAISNAKAIVNANFDGVFNAINPDLNIDFSSYEFFTEAFEIGDVFDQILDLLIVDIDGDNATIQVNSSSFTFSFDIDTSGDNQSEPGTGESSGTLTINGSGASLLNSNAFTPNTFQAIAFTYNFTNGPLGTADQGLNIYINTDTNNVIFISYGEPTSWTSESNIRRWLAETPEWNETTTGQVNVTFDGETFQFSNAVLELTDADENLVTNQEIILNGSLSVP